MKAANTKLTWFLKLPPEIFGAGIVHGILNEFNPQFQVDYALAAAILKLTIPGDFNLSTDEEIAAMVSPNNGINRYLSFTGFTSV